MEAEQIRKEYQTEIKHLNAVIEVLASDIQEIKKALIGNEYGDEGLVRRVAKAEREILDLKDFKKKIMYMAGALGFGSSALVNAITELIK